jgi:hypothetical protein
MPQLAVLGADGTLPFINDARVGVSSATLRGGIESPCSNGFHGHGKPTMINAIGLSGHRTIDID